MYWGHVKVTSPTRQIKFIGPDFQASDTDVYRIIGYHWHCPRNSHRQTCPNSLLLHNNQSYWRAAIYYADLDNILMQTKCVFLSAVVINHQKWNVCGKVWQWKAALSSQTKLDFWLRSLCRGGLLSWQWITNTVKPVCNDHLYDEIYYLWFIQKCVQGRLKVPVYSC